ncbi:MAG: Aspartyl-tRNA(Asn) amidotransferase subunit C [Candidatus Jettenia ecosi]|uniref:Aspartyl/glutamyl-tRNA(Asn/Gln) amidotransferase subunit C n=1 Tax=Candidatus Jettenia ecosi TaxID=2494326 RepID=A0A533Q6G2_9BACT|nr:MAG: Aspartyl-tRNA(Asn) amidotransferase subunit C [Candidatus Jettenia ecosi]
MDKKEIEYIANLSRIELTEAEKEVFIHQLSNILSYIEKLNTLDTENIKPLAHTMNASNVFREDKPESSISREDVFINATAKIDTFFKVPKVIE